MQTITIGSNTYNLVTLPSSPAPSDLGLGMNDAVAVQTSPFTRAEQTQYWPGGDFWDATITLPPLSSAQAAAWRGATAELSGRAYVVQLGDRSQKQPAGAALGIPEINAGSGLNAPMTKVLSTFGWTPNIARILLPGDYLQVGYRLYVVTEVANSASDGTASVSIWPSIRETPAGATPIILNQPVGLFRLAANRRSLQVSKDRLTTLSLSFVEAR
ncbi:MAG TPA: hypothetical protein VKB47_18015 [Terracidiphilus sp.]|nr:hypothetical protein [Terracidiphilus sp.]